MGDQYELVLLWAKSKLHEIMFNRGKFSCMIMTGMNLVNCELQTARCDVLSFCVSALLLLVAWHAVDVPSQHWCLPKDNGVWGVMWQTFGFMALLSVTMFACLASAALHDVDS